MIELSRAHLAAIARAAEEAYPEECCGLLVGTIEGARRRVTRVAPSANVAEGDRRKRFEVDPRLILKFQRELRGGAERLVGHYHSHPDGPAAPSATDAKEIWEPDLAWLIVPVAAGRAGPPAAHEPSAEGGFRQLTLREVGAGSRA